MVLRHVGPSVPYIGDSLAARSDSAVCGERWRRVLPNASGSRLVCRLEEVARRNDLRYSRVREDQHRVVAAYVLASYNRERPASR